MCTSISFKKYRCIECVLLLISVSFKRFSIHRTWCAYYIRFGAAYFIKMLFSSGSELCKNEKQKNVEQFELTIWTSKIAKPNCCKIL